ncbi:LytR/AlgR family response regulator transcription factor [Bizionia sp.]|uniref:LytR/AlgR family response regulator transcription factor n=1 Tax=Bizionia sp. TaxID=1954480 RepID=UPI003A927E18
MYKILIIEDEAPARKKLKRFIAEVCGAYTIVAELETVEDTKTFLKQALEIDIIFSDIQLRDGNIFEVYNTITLNCPIIFATAYNAFLINAFEANGIEYLLKPYSLERFSKAWNKFIRLHKTNPVNNNQLMETIHQLLKNNQSVSKSYKNQFAIKMASETYFLKTESIVYFQADNGIICAFDTMNKCHVMPQATLKEIEVFLDPQKFFRINRSESVQRQYINKIKRYNKNTLSIHLNAGQKTLKTSQSKTSDFNNWLDL